MFSILISPTIRSSLSLNVIFAVIGFAVRGRFRGVDESPPPPPNVTRPVGVLYDFFDDRRALPQRGASQTLNNGKSMGRFVVITATNASLVPQDPAS